MHPSRHPRAIAAAFLGVALSLAATAFGDESKSATGTSTTTTTTTTTTAIATKETALQRIQKMVMKINAEASTPEGEQAVVARLSSQLAVSPDTLVAQHLDWGLGYGEVAMAYGFSRAGKKRVPPAEVVEMRRSGMDWEAIGKNLGVKVDSVASKMKKSAAPKPTPAPK